MVTAGSFRQFRHWSFQYSLAFLISRIRASRNPRIQETRGVLPRGSFVLKRVGLVHFARSHEFLITDSPWPLHRFPFAPSTSLPSIPKGICHTPSKGCTPYPQITYK